MLQPFKLKGLNHLDNKFRAQIIHLTDMFQLQITKVEYNLYKIYIASLCFIIPTLVPFFSVFETFHFPLRSSGVANLLAVVPSPWPRSPNVLQGAATRARCLSTASISTIAVLSPFFRAPKSC